MANTVRIKRSTGSSAPTSLANAELAHAQLKKLVEKEHFLIKIQYRMQIKF